MAPSLPILGACTSPVRAFDGLSPTATLFVSHQIESAVASPWKDHLPKTAIPETFEAPGLHRLLVVRFCSTNGKATRDGPGGLETAPNFNAAYTGQRWMGTMYGTSRHLPA
ncbi:hypothetical protein NMY22_g17703 [Coprinellus aureogranulatus]|nr:hypothetical protein NMY22_g17703 [Coprinellus aureogranulatus]